MERGSRVIFANDLLESLAYALDYRVTDKDKLNALYDGLGGAMSSYRASAGMYDRGTFKDAKEGVSRIDRALQKLIDQRGKREKAIESLSSAIRDLRRYTPDIFTELDALEDLHSIMPEDIERSVFERLAERQEANDFTALKKVTVSFLLNMKTLGRGGARSEARKYIAGIHSLMNTFEEVLPDCSIYAQSNSLFVNYVRYWLKNFADSQVSEPERHIKNAIAERPS